MGDVVYVFDSSVPSAGGPNSLVGTTSAALQAKLAADPNMIFVQAADVAAPRPGKHRWWWDTGTNEVVIEPLPVRLDEDRIGMLELIVAGIVVLLEDVSGGASAGLATDLRAKLTTLANDAANPIALAEAAVPGTGADYVDPTVVGWSNDWAIIAGGAIRFSGVDIT